MSVVLAMFLGAATISHISSCQCCTVCESLVAPQNSLQLAWSGARA